RRRVSPPPYTTLFRSWIDAEGRIHNTLKSDADRKKNDRSKAGENERPSSSSSDDNYLTEDEFAAEQERIRLQSGSYHQTMMRMRSEEHTSELQSPANL